MKITINRKYGHLTGFIHKINTSFEGTGNLIYEGRNQLKTYLVGDTCLVVKRFKTPILLNRFVYSFIRKSKARRSYELALELVERGVSTPDPIAYIEVKENGLLKESYYICIYERKGEEIREYVNGIKKDAPVLEGIASFTYMLHQKNVFHRDYSPGNILMERQQDGKYSFSIVDINRLSFKKLTRKERYRNFNRLCRSYEATVDVARAYALLNGYPEKEAISEINRYSDDYFAGKAYSLAIRKTAREKGWVEALIYPFRFYLLMRIIHKMLPFPSLYKRLFLTEQRIYHQYVAQYDHRKVFIRKYHF